MKNICYLQNKYYLCIVKSISQCEEIKIQAEVFIVGNTYPFALCTVVCLKIFRFFYQVYCLFSLRTVCNNTLIPSYKRKSEHLFLHAIGKLSGSNFKANFVGSDKKFYKRNFTFSLRELFSFSSFFALSFSFFF